MITYRSFLEDEVGSIIKLTGLDESIAAQASSGVDWIIDITSIDAVNFGGGPLEIDIEIRSDSRKLVPTTAYSVIIEVLPCYVFDVDTMNESLTDVSISVGEQKVLVFE